MKKGEVWLVELPQGRGREQVGARPALVMANANGLVIVIPFTSNVERAKLAFTHVIEPSQENGLSSPSVALVFQITALDEACCTRKMGWLPREQRAAIDELLKALLKINA